MKYTMMIAVLCCAAACVSPDEHHRLEREAAVLKIQRQEAEEQLRKLATQVERLRSEDPDLAARDADALALADREPVDPFVASENTAVVVDERTGPPSVGAVLLRHPPVLPGLGETQVLAFRAMQNGQIQLVGNAPNSRLLPVAERKERVAKLFLRQVEQEVGLVLLRVRAAQQVRIAPGVG